LSTKFVKLTGDKSSEGGELTSQFGEFVIQNTVFLGTDKDLFNIRASNVRIVDWLDSWF
jgi:hypothetical protein